MRFLQLFKDIFIHKVRNNEANLGYLKILKQELSCAKQNYVPKGIKNKSKFLMKNIGTKVRGT